jgi:hypothetical protein
MNNALRGTLSPRPPAPPSAMWLRHITSVGLGYFSFKKKEEERRSLMLLKKRKKV